MGSTTSVITNIIYIKEVIKEVRLELMMCCNSVSA